AYSALLAPHVELVAALWIARCGHHGRARCHARSAADLHRQAIAHSMVDASVYFLGLPACGCNHIPTRVWLGALPLRNWRSDDLRHLRVWVSSRLFSNTNCFLLADFPRSRYCRRDGFGGRVLGPLAQAARSGCASDAVVCNGLLPVDPADGDF